VAAVVATQLEHQDQVELVEVETAEHNFQVRPEQLEQ
jgi:hypothetical protein